MVKTIELIPHITVFIKKNRYVMVMFSFIKTHLFYFTIPIKLNINRYNITTRTPNFAILINGIHKIRIGVFRNLWFI